MAEYCKLRKPESSIHFQRIELIIQPKYQIIIQRIEHSTRFYGKYKMEI